MYFSWLAVNILYWSTMFIPWVTSTLPEMFPIPDDELGCPEGFELQLGSNIARKIMTVWSRLGVHLPSGTDSWSISDRDVTATSYMTYLGKAQGACQYDIMVMDQHVAVVELFIGAENKPIYIERVGKLEKLGADGGTLEYARMKADSGNINERLYLIVRKPYVDFFETAGYQKVLQDDSPDSNEMMRSLFKQVSVHVAETVYSWCSSGYAKWKRKDSAPKIEDFLFSAAFPYEETRLAIADVDNWVDLKGRKCNAYEALTAKLDTEESIEKQLRTPDSN